VARLLTSVYDRGLRAAGIDAPQFALLASIAQEQPCTQTALGRLHALDKSTASRNLAMLHRSGWIAFEPTSDGRERSVVLTAAGKRQLAKAHGAWQRAQQEIRLGMSTTQWEAMFEAFRVVGGAARAAQDREVARAKPFAARPPSRATATVSRRAVAR
jgi:DNA-binding MarR family transcriptional regulator